MRNAKYCVFWPSIRENHNIFRYQQVRIRFNLLVRVSDSPDRNVSFLTAPNRLDVVVWRQIQLVLKARGIKHQLVQTIDVGDIVHDNAQAADILHAVKRHILKPLELFDDRGRSFESLSNDRSGELVALKNAAKVGLQRIGRIGVQSSPLGENVHCLILGHDV